MPYLQLDVPARYSLEVKRGLARRLGNLYAEIMLEFNNSTPDLTICSSHQSIDACAEAVRAASRSATISARMSP
jgi:hypothetical protein